MPRNWLEVEPGLRTALKEIGRLYRRAWRRWPVTLGVTILIALGFVSFLRFKKHTFSPQVVLRVIEADHVYGVAPRPKRKLRDYVQQAIFSSRSLAEIMHAHGLYPALARTNPQAALTSFKEDIHVDVYRNFFVEERMANDPPRSARISIRYRSPDRQVALAVARDLAKLVREFETRSRTNQVAAALQDATRTLARARAELLEQRRAMAQKTQQVGSDPQAAVELANLQRSSATLERRVVDANARKTSLELNASLEAEALGLRFELVDSGAIPESASLSTRDFVLAGFLAFLLGLPLVALFVGAFDGRVREPGDLERLGINVLGQLRVSEQKIEGYV